MFVFSLYRFKINSGKSIKSQFFNWRKQRSIILKSTSQSFAFQIFIFYNEIVENIVELQTNIKLYVVIGQLNQLIKGGRISKTKGLIGNMMKIKPIGTLEDGKIELIHNSRTQNASVQFLKKEVSAFIGDKNVKSIGIAHANIIEFVDKVKKHFSEEFNFTKFDTNVTTPIISTHTGQGAIGLVVLRS